MQIGRPALPLDPDERRRLWREWIHADAPAGKAAPARRAERPADWLYEALPAQPANAIEGLSAAVRDALVGGELPASDRARLLCRAEKLGLKRFEATLLIAAVQHRVRNAAVPARVTVLPPRREFTFGVGKLLACVVALEAAAVVGLAMWMR